LLVTEADGGLLVGLPARVDYVFVAKALSHTHNAATMRIIIHIA